MMKYFGLAIVAALLGAVGYWVWSGSGTPVPVPGATGGSGEVAVAPSGPEGAMELEFPEFRLDTAPLVEAWDAERAVPFEGSDAEASLLDAWHRANFAEGLSARGLFEGDLGALVSDLDRQRREWSQLKTSEQWLRLGWEAFRSFERGLGDLLRLAETTDTDLNALLDDPIQPIVHQYYEACGGFLENALAFGMVGPTGEMHVQPELFVLLFRYRWAWQAQDTYPTTTSLPSRELAAFTRWRFEDAQMDFQARMRLIHQYEREYGFDGLAYPIEYALAVALAKGGQDERARESLVAALAADPENEIVRAAAARLGL